MLIRKAVGRKPQPRPKVNVHSLATIEQRGTSFVGSYLPICSKVNAFCTVEYRFSVENDGLAARSSVLQTTFSHRYRSLSIYSRSSTGRCDDVQKSKDSSALNVVVWTVPISRTQCGTTLRHVLQKSPGLVRRG